MKNLIIPTILLFALGLVSCQNKINPEQEKDAIMKVILKESEAARDGDFEGLMSTYLDDDNTVRLYYSRDEYEISQGFDAISVFLDFIKQNADRDLSEVEVSKENPIMKIMGRSAWVLCDNIWHGIYEGEEFSSDNLQITFLEKVKGEWKISFVTWLPKAPSGGEIIQNNSMIANWTFRLKEDVDASEAEDFLRNEIIPAYEKNYDGIKLFLLKSDRGSVNEIYSLLLIFDSVDERNAWWPERGQSSEKAKEAEEKMMDLPEKLQSMVEMVSWNDWVVMK